MIDQAMTNRFFLFIFNFKKRIQRKISKEIPKSECFFGVSDQEACQKFEGSFLGALIGITVGNSYEGIWGPTLLEMIQEYTEIKYQTRPIPTQVQSFNGDMTIALALTESIIFSGDLDLPNAAFFFQKKFHNQIDVIFSTGTITICNKFRQLMDRNELNNNCMIPAMELFDGSGSFGSGAAVRSFPIALFTYCKSLDEMTLCSELNTRLTHTHILAIIGAHQQNYAIREAFNNNTLDHSFDFNAYFLKVIRHILNLEKAFENSDRIFYEKINDFSENMQKNLNIYLSQKDQANKNKTCTNNLYSTVLIKLYKEFNKCQKGNKPNFRLVFEKIDKKIVSSIRSITTALIAFIVSSDPKCEHELNDKLMSVNARKAYSPIERVMFYSLTFCGESETVGGLAGALVGAFYGRRACPSYLIQMCSNHEIVRQQAYQLFQITNNPRTI